MPAGAHVPLTLRYLCGHFFQQAYPKITFTLTKPRPHSSHVGSQEEEEHFLQFDIVHAGDKKKKKRMSLSSV